MRALPAFCLALCLNFAASAQSVLTYPTGSSGAQSAAISNVSAGTPASTTATITWNTALNATSGQACWGASSQSLCSSYTSNVADSTPASTAHSAALTGLTSSTTYHYRAESTYSTYFVDSTDATFATAAVASETWNPQTSPACQNLAFGTTTATFSVTIGVGTEVVAVTDDQHATYTSVTVNSVSGASQSSTPYVSLWSAASAASGTANVVVVAPFNLNQICIATGYITNTSSSTATCSGSCPVLAGTFSGSPASLGTSLPVTTGGFGIVAAVTLSSASLPFSWTSATRDSATEIAAASGLSLGLGHTTATATPSFGYANPNQTVGMAGAAWH